MKEFEEKLYKLQQELKKSKTPVIIIFEGWGASGKGYTIGKIIQGLDPRGFKVFTTGEASFEDKRYPLMKRFWRTVPQRGEISVYDRSWYREVTLAKVENELSKKEIDFRFREILEFERQLGDDGYIIIKFFLRLSKKEQRDRFKELESVKSTSWRVTKQDWKRNDRYDEYEHTFTEMIERTDRDYAKWHLIEAGDKKSAVKNVFEHIIKTIEQNLSAPLKTAEIRTPENILPSSKLSDTDLNVTHDDSEYKKQLKKAQKRLFELHNELYQTKTPLIIVYEGWDAAGKGGNIKRLTEGLDPRGYEVIPISAPTPPELNRHYLWRFWQALPKDGHIAIFDRSWYGRVMVERIEKLIPETEWKRAYAEINNFECSLHDRGAVIIKFWLHIDKDEQLKRFTARQTTPEKQWKITDEDWRNREKWDAYESAVNEMLEKTNTEYAPWKIIESNDKKYARLKAINEVINEIERNLKS